MPKYIAQRRSEVPPETVWPLVSDLTRHGEWSADPVTVTATADGYESVASSKGREFRARLTVLESVEPRRFAFRAVDSTGTYDHVLTLEPDGGGTRITREVSAHSLSPAQRLLYYAALPIRKGSASRSLDRLAEAASR